MWSWRVVVFKKNNVFVFLVKSGHHSSQNIASYIFVQMPFQQWDKDTLRDIILYNLLVQACFDVTADVTSCFRISWPAYGNGRRRRFHSNTLISDVVKRWLLHKHPFFKLYEQITTSIQLLFHSVDGISFFSIFEHGCNSKDNRLIC